jgi:hypothetical protein
MAEKKEKAADKGADKGAAKAETVADTPADAVRGAKKKSRWTLEACMKAARRFDVRAEWAEGAPSSYKAAVARGWVEQCAKHMTGTPARKTAKPAAAAAKKTTTKTGKDAGAGRVTKKSA